MQFSLAKKQIKLLTKIKIASIYTYSMALPLDLLNDDTSNVYELSVAMARRAYQITMSGEQDEEAESEGLKPVVAAIRQILTQKVQYQLDT